MIKSRTTKKRSCLMKLKEMIVGLLILNVVLALAVGMFIFFAPNSSYGFQTDTTTPPTTTAPAPATEKAPAPDTGSSTEKGWGYVAAALSTGIAALGAGVAVSGVGSAAMGAISERPELLGRSLIFVGLAEGIAIYGLIISIMILGRLG
jgi:F0F1-type ATP synthase membrane subunit c/vacuolar-type H+-ATPase subunit K